jgi:carbohydrate-binding DOMON domain-containing protein
MEHDSHEAVMKGVREQLADIFDKSDQSVYVYLDDANKACNKRFASLLGYASPAEWAKVEQNFPEVFVQSKERRTLVKAYQNAMNNLVGSTISIKWKKKGGGEVPTTTILVPIVYEGHRMALHFITPT